MKAIPFALALGLTLAAPMLNGMESVPVPAPAADSDSDSAKLVQVQVEFIELSHEALTNLLFLSEPTNANALELRKKVQDLVVKKEATVLETQLVTGRDGDKSRTDSIGERIYPTEYEPPELPGSFGPGPLPARGQDSSPSVATPTAFDTRNCGSTLEIEPRIHGDGKGVILRFVPELVWHTGNTIWMEIKDGLGNGSKIQMPDFYSLRLSTQTICPDHQYVLAAALSPKNGKGETDMSRKVMVFVKCDILGQQ